MVHRHGRASSARREHTRNRRPRLELNSRQHLKDPRNEGVKVRHKIPQKFLCRIYGNKSVIADQVWGKLNIGFGRVHLRRVAERKDAAETLLSDRSANRSR